jgi:hypothetical protein
MVVTNSIANIGGPGWFHDVLHVSILSYHLRDHLHAA